MHEGTAGEGLGIEAESAAFGPLTCNAGTIKVSDGRISQTIDVRYPDSITCDEMSMICRAHAARYGAEFVLDSTKEPFSTSAESPAVQALLDTYREVTGKHAEPFSMGGGTYARNFKSAVSFGPEDNDLELPEWQAPCTVPTSGERGAFARRSQDVYLGYSSPQRARAVRDAGAAEKEPRCPIARVYRMHAGIGREAIVPNFWEQIFGFVIIALSMVFGGYLYRRRHGDDSGRTGTAGRPRTKRPRKRG